MHGQDTNYNFWIAQNIKCNAPVIWLPLWTTAGENAAEKRIGLREGKTAVVGKAGIYGVYRGLFLAGLRHDLGMKASDRWSPLQLIAQLQTVCGGLTSCQLQDEARGLLATVGRALSRVGASAGRGVG